MKKLFIILLLMAFSLSWQNAFCEEKCCDKARCIDGQTECCRDGKCKSKNRCCSDGECRCQPAKERVKCGCSEK